MSEQDPLSRPIQLGFAAGLVESPEVTYGPELTSVRFPLEEGGFGRVTFEGLDSIRVSRGEHLPYPESDDGGGPPWPWVYVVDGSPWLAERHAYESRFYRGAYEFGGNVDEMLTEYRHFLLSFHDEFVEAIARGIWVETSDEELADNGLSEEHPFHGLTHLEPDAMLESSGVRSAVYTNPKPAETLVHDARLCSQKLIQVAALLDGRKSVHWTLELRASGGRPRSILRSCLGRQECSFDGVAGLSDIQHTIISWMEEVAARRRKKGTSD